MDRLIGRDARSTSLWLAGAYLAWCLTDAMEVVTAYQADAFRLRLVYEGFRASFPAALWLGWAGILAHVGRSWAGGRNTNGSSMRMAAGFLILVGLARLVAFLPPVGAIFPWLGLLWSPAATWAAALFVCLYPVASPGNDQSTSGPLPWRLPAAVFVAFALLYGAYAIYFVKTTELHGDEPQYLLMSQSLLEDGDLDLANVDADDKLAFHEFLFDVHWAPASPPGKRYSSHPIGLPVLSALPYAIGERILGHPRLAVVLFQSFLSALACALIIPFLVRQGFTPIVSATTAIVIGFTPPLFSQSNQIYPEVHAVLAALWILILYPEWLFGKQDRPSTGALAAACMALVLVPFFHQRHLVLAGVLAIPVLTDLYRSGTGTPRVRICLAILLGGVGLHLFHNLTFSGDIWGPFLPGNADSLGPDLAQSIPGHWIDRREGLLRNAPVYLAGLLGLVIWIRGRDRRALLFFALYLSTVGVNHLSSDWTFGFCYPSRFVVAGLPALALVVAAGLNAVLQGRTSWSCFLFLVAFCLSVETNVQNAILPEIGFEGLNLVSRVSEAVYPSAIHFVDFVSGDPMPFGVLLFWALTIAAFCLVTSKALRLRRAGWLTAAVASGLAGAVLPYAETLAGSFAYQVPRWSDEEEAADYQILNIPVQVRSVGEGVHTSDMPPLFRGIVAVRPSVVGEEGEPGVRGFHTYTVMSGSGQGAVRTTVPLIGGDTQSLHGYMTEGTGVSQQYMYDLGLGTLPGATVWSLTAGDPERVVTKYVTTFEERTPVGMTLTGFESGHYRLYLDREGIGWADWLERGQGSTVLAVFSGFGRVRTDEAGLKKMAARWLDVGWRDLHEPLPRGVFPPQVEARVPYFQSVLPLGVGGTSVSFTVEKSGPIHLVMVPDPSVRVTGIRIDRMVLRGETGPQ